MAKQTQLDKFKQAARNLGTDDNEKRFNERLSKLAAAKARAETQEDGQAVRLIG